jgi:N utilization substance protein A
MELLQVADAVAREKNIDQDIVLGAMEEAIQKAGRSKYGHDHDIRAHIDRKSGDIELKRYREVVEEIEDEATQLTLGEAQRINKSIKIGEFLIDELPPLDFGRIAAQTAKQVIVQKVREAERARQYIEFKDRVGEMINGVIKRVEYGNATVDMGGRAEALLRRDEALPREHLKNGDRVRAFIYDVREETRGPQIFLSRTRPEFMEKLFTQEVPEIYDGIIEIKAVARDPGSRAKIAVISNDGSIDPVGACVGMRGSRVQAVVNELQGEKIDIVPWTEDIATFTVNALQPAEVSKVVLDEQSKRMEVVVPEEHLSLAIGRRGQNVRLASILSGWDIDIMTEEQESERRAAEFKKRSDLFIQALDVDDVIAHLLVAEGFTSIEEISDASIEELNQIEGFEEEVSIELQARANLWLEEQQKLLKEKQKELDIKDDLMELEGLAPDVIIKLGKNEIKSRDDLADLATDELIEILGEDEMKEKEAEALIMRAREHWFENDENSETEASSEESSSEEKVEDDKGTKEEASTETETQEQNEEVENLEVKEKAANEDDSNNEEAEIKAEASGNA